MFERDEESLERLRNVPERRVGVWQSMEDVAMLIGWCHCQDLPSRCEQLGGEQRLVEPAVVHACGKGWDSTPTTSG